MSAAQDDRSIWLPTGISRRDALNDRTIHTDRPLLALAEGEVELSFAELFALHYERIRTAALRHAEPGLLAMALSETGVKGELWLAAAEGVSAAVVGRHGCADLYLPEDPSLSLRHLALLVRKDGERVETRVLDLRTGLGFLDERARKLEAISVDGPAFIAVSRQRMLLLPTGKPFAWPADAAAGYGQLPERVFLDERSFDSLGPVPRRKIHFDADVTHVTSLHAAVPMEVAALLAEGEDPLGHLVLAMRGMSTRIAIGKAAASRGLLLGRYSRCEVGGRVWDTRQALSRVHAVVLRTGGEMTLVDAASTNGTVLGEKKIRCAPFRRGQAFVLGKTVEIAWEDAA